MLLKAYFEVKLLTVEGGFMNSLFLKKYTSEFIIDLV